jgi:hypothetical protein
VPPRAEMTGMAWSPHLGGDGPVTIVGLATCDTIFWVWDAAFPTARSNSKCTNSIACEIVSDQTLPCTCSLIAVKVNALTPTKSPLATLLPLQTVRVLVCCWLLLSGISRRM